MSKIRLVVQQEGKVAKTINLLFAPVALLTIYSMVIPLMLIDAWTQLYQFIFFSLRGIPKIKRSEYLLLDRYQLKTLNVIQKISCVYCGYANGIVAWLKEVVNQTEIYSCAIKHSTEKKGQEHHEKFHSFSDFQD